MPEILVTQLKRLFSKIYSADITNVKVTKALLKKVFPAENAKRVTRHSPNPPATQLAKISYADPDLNIKQNCIPAGYESYDITNTQYSEEIDGDTVGTLGVNCNKGKFYLSKNLSSTQFRNWSVRRISDIIGYFQNVNETSIEAVTGFNMFSSSDWEGTKPLSVDFLTEIVGVIYPYLLDDQLKYSLYHHAKVNNKRIVILAELFLTHYSQALLKQGRSCL